MTDNGIGTLLVLVIPVLIYSLVTRLRRSAMFTTPNPIIDPHDPADIIWVTAVQRAHRQRRRPVQETPAPVIDIHRDAWTACRSVHPDSREPLRRQIQHRAERLTA